jgi:methenyltetrahydrofolate cyclohydrolase
VGASAERPLGELLAELAARTPAPGAGCASAWTGSLAAALTEMVARFVHDAGAAARAAECRVELLAAGERELSSYQPVFAASRLPAGDPARKQRLDDALSEASEPPFAIAQASAEVAELAASIAAKSKKAVAGDAIAATVLAEASSRAAARLVEINLAGRGNDLRLAVVRELVERSGAARKAALR